jgi:ribonuclease Z
LALTHLSPRYVPGNAVTAEDLLLEARAIFPETVLASDFLCLSVGETEVAARQGTSP